ncbi:GNAT family N-acetyltransferase [Flaviflagellibacter deserti]|jgi:ribosomal protein S18 acetylase RimI-like enzyme|uniref:GNAT family N-acetyltransferase n=1 Tax=Flaviflagellibacter deserti TaxID=2267266 RepID=A0ABV9YVJ3_9HYPH
MTHVLDRPIWSALGTSHAALAEENGLARRYPPSIIPFVATGDSDPASLDGLERFVGPEDELFTIQADPIVIPGGLMASMEAPGVQMVADRLMPEIHDPRLKPLDESDAADMLELALLTKPGPFTLRAQSLGEFWGIKEEERLIGMVGVRFRQPGLTEISGLCTHPDVRGRGLGTLLLTFMAGRIYARGEQPYLHTFASNTGAIALYESLGFRLRREMYVAAMRRPD